MKLSIVLVFLFSFSLSHRIPVVKKCIDDFDCSDDFMCENNFCLTKNPTDFYSVYGDLGHLNSESIDENYNIFGDEIENNFLLYPDLDIKEVKEIWEDKEKTVLIKSIKFKYIPLSEIIKSVSETYQTLDFEISREDKPFIQPITKSWPEYFTEKIDNGFLFLKFHLNNLINYFIPKNTTPD